MNRDLVDSAAILENQQIEPKLPSGGAKSPHENETLDTQSVITSTASESTGVVGTTDQEQGIDLNLPIYLDSGDTCHYCFFFLWNNFIIHNLFDSY